MLHLRRNRSGRPAVQQLLPLLLLFFTLGSSASEPLPWPDRETFYAEIDSPRMAQLRAFLLDTIPQQTRFIVRRLQASLPKMTATLTDARQRDKVEQAFHRLARSPRGLYALIDYVNFKGEGTSPKERYQDKGWGLLQVLLVMDDSNPDPVNAFVQAAEQILSRRVQLAPRDEQRWLPGWRKRLQSYVLKGDMLKGNNRR